MYRTLFYSILFLILSGFVFDLFAQDQTAIFDRYVTAHRLHLRAAPSQGSPSLGLLPFGQKVSLLKDTLPVIRETIEDISGAWVKIRVGSKTGFVFGPYLQGSLPPYPKEAIVILTNGSLNCRSYCYSPDYFWYELPENGSLQYDSLRRVFPSIRTWGEGEMKEITYSDKIPGRMLIGYREEPSQKKIRIANTMQRHPRTMFPGKIIHIWSTEEGDDPNAPFQRVSYDLIAYGSVSKQSLTIIDDYRIVLREFTKDNEGFHRKNHDMTLRAFWDKDYESLQFELSDSVAQKLASELTLVVFAGDLNGDGAPDFILSDSDGKNLSYVLILSAKHSQGLKYRVGHVVTGWNCC